MTHQCAFKASALWLTPIFGMAAAVAGESPRAGSPRSESSPAESSMPAPSEERAVAEGLAPPAKNAAEAVQAIWKHQEISFYFQSFTTFYSCTGLEAKMQRLMDALGTHAKVRVRSADCPSSVARMPRVVMNVISPVEATPEALADRDKNKSVRELAQRLQGKTNSANPLDSLEQFPAQWRKVALKRGSLNLEPGDCELIEELQKKVLPKLAVRVTDDDLQCSPNQLILGQPRLEVEALMELPKADEIAAGAHRIRRPGRSETGS